MKKPGFWRVVAAYFIDVIIAQFGIGAIIWAMATIIMIGLQHLLNMREYEMLIFAPLFLLVVICCPIPLYFGWFSYKRKTTLGKKLMGLQVTQKEETK